ncbi:SIR2 family protein [Microbacteriaceae bacterium VKM Ac-2855]|nr:SIR2 family protein [Microbacteriaceae bacterium VKM Ac-2855]
MPFLGAGTSVSAGGPSWNELLASLADGLAPAPALLASLTAEQAITLNYDSLFETAAADAGAPRAVIKAASAPHAGRRWLLKLHGDVADPDTIVLTRNDYVGYNASRVALLAIVTSTMATRHLLFVGFGFTDPHFHEILHDVVNAFPSSAPDGAALATALTLTADPLVTELWKGKLDLELFGDGSNAGAAARRLELFLDALLAFASDGVGYLLADGHKRALRPAEQQLRARLLAFVADASAAEKQTPAWREIERLIERFGGYTAQRINCDRVVVQAETGNPLSATRSPADL